MEKNFYITTTLPYVNSDPHIGFAMEIIRADVLARFMKQQGYRVIFNTGTDEHGVKIYQKATERNMDPKSYCDEYAAKFNNLKTSLNLSYTNFIRTTDPYHVKAAREFWKRCFAKGDIYKKNYKIRYCVGCELEKTDSELVDGTCPVHPNRKLEIYEEENYFFSFSKYRNALLELYDKNPAFVIPDFRLHEIRAFVEKGLEDFSISRLKKKMPWGIDVPDDPEHVMYVWFDALINYISTIGWPDDMDQFRKYWPGFQIAGKDNLRQQSAMWQAMLMSAGIQPSKQIFVEGFITSQGQKMSKSLGNVINPMKLVSEYGIDAVRYYLLREIPDYADGDFSHARMKELYNADLANELGNLIMRITTLGEQDKLHVVPSSPARTDRELLSRFQAFKYNGILENIWTDIKRINKKVDEFAPWKKSTDQRKKFLLETILHIHTTGERIYPFMPETARKIMNSTQGTITKVKPLFPKL